jgi:hypothetical protein
MRLAPHMLALSAATLLASPASAQGAVKDTTPPPLFASVAPLEVTFTTNLRRLRADKDTNAPWRPATMTYAGPAGPVVLPMRAKTRGVWRLKNCHFPPLRLDFPGKESKGTPFAHLGKPKLVNFCRDDDSHEQFILQEIQLYRAYQLLTPVSYRTRLLRMTYVDSAKADTMATRYAFVAEDPEALAKRLGGKVVRIKGAAASDLEPAPLAVAYVFQYMIGNTDFSFNGLHNTQLVQLTDGTILPVAYDFDWSGAVNASYAAPNATLRLRRITDRKYRGYCAIGQEALAALPLFRARKDDIYALYRDEIGRRMDPERVRRTLRYFDEFFEMIETPESAKRAFLDDCVGPT